MNNLRFTVFPLGVLPMSTKTVKTALQVHVFHHLFLQIAFIYLFSINNLWCNTQSYANEHFNFNEFLMTELRISSRCDVHVICSEWIWSTSAHFKIQPITTHAKPHPWTYEEEIRQQGCQNSKTSFRCMTSSGTEHRHNPISRPLLWNDFAYNNSRQ